MKASIEVHLIVNGTRTLKGGEFPSLQRGSNSEACARLDQKHTKRNGAFLF
jgi:hypothetical protein